MAGQGPLSAQESSVGGLAKHIRGKFSQLVESAHFYLGEARSLLGYAHRQLGQKATNCSDKHYVLRLAHRERVYGHYLLGQARVPMNKLSDCSDTLIYF